MRVLMVSTYGIACGIAEHAALLDQAVHDATRDTRDLAITIEPTLLDPSATWPFIPDVLHINYHDALHSRWQPDTIQRAKALGCKILLTLHDSGTPNSDHARAICGAADAFVVHEPYDDLPAHGTYLRMGVPDWQSLYLYDRSSGSWCGQRPILGTIGFSLGFKCYDELAKITAACGWALLLIAPNTTPEEQIRWHDLNPHVHVVPEFVDRHRAVSLLAGCDATAFTFVCHNTGQSASILQGVAARKPVIALSTCRMMRALYLDPLGRETIHWCENFDVVAQTLRTLPIGRVDPGIVALAAQESWAYVGARYAEIYRGLCA